jgi:hypothetical protein
MKFTVEKYPLKNLVPICDTWFIEKQIQRVHKVREHFKLFIAQELQIIQTSYTCHFEEKLKLWLQVACAQKRRVDVPV